MPITTAGGSSVQCYQCSDTEPRVGMHVLAHAGESSWASSAQRSWLSSHTSETTGPSDLVTESPHAHQCVLQELGTLEPFQTIPHKPFSSTRHLAPTARTWREMMVLREIWILREAPVQCFDEMTQMCRPPQMVDTEKIPHSVNPCGLQRLREIRRSKHTQSEFDAQET